ncbi:MAG: hypothetical protein IJS12_08335 [Lachnospiraceae bacterium]|nr:hypothetical protein [Lachnospiraceae bacterium]
MNFDIPAPKEKTPSEGADKKTIQTSPITSDTRMSVSGILHRGDKRSVCVMIETDSSHAEIRMPEGEILSVNGYTDEETEEILAYLTENMDDIMNAARDVNPMKAFMK